MTDETGAVSFGDADNSGTTEVEKDQGALSNDGSNDGGGQEDAKSGAVTGELDATPEKPDLSEKSLAFAKSKGWNGPEDFGKAIDSYQELEQKYSSVNLSLKEGDLTDDDWSDFRQRSGAPEKADAYQFSQPEDMPAHVMYDDALMSKHKEVAHKIGLNPQQFKEQTQLIQDHMIDQQVKAYQAQDQRVEDAGSDLRNEWKNDAVLEDKLATSFNSINASPALKDEYIRVGLLVPIDGQPGKYSPSSSALVQYHAEIGEVLQKESSGFTGVGVQNQIGSQNPFKEGAAWNETHQAALVRDDPQRARMFITQAGLSPGDYM